MKGARGGQGRKTLQRQENRSSSTTHRYGATGRHPLPRKQKSNTNARARLLDPLSPVADPPKRYGFLLRVKAMGMSSSIDRERKIATYWARLMDEANSYDDDEDAAGDD